MGDDEPCKIVGNGKVQIKLNNGNDWLLKDVRHIPVMKRNQISTGQLGDSSCLSTFGETWWKITKGSLVIAKGDRQQETTQEENVAGDMLQDALILALDNTSDYWVVDSGASCHATPHRKFFYYYVPSDFGHVS